MPPSKRGGGINIIGDKMNLFKEKSRARWLLSYLVIILCLFTAMAIIIGVYSTSLKKEMNEFNEFVFESVAASVNDVLAEVNDLHMNIRKSDKLKAFMSFNGNRHQSQISYDLINEFTSSKELANNVGLFFIYLKDEDIVVSNNGITDSKTYYNYYFNIGDISYEEWKNVFLEFKNDEYISMKCLNKFDKVIDSIGFLFQAPLNSTEAVGAILCDKKHFMSNIENVEWKNLCDIYIYNGQGDLMLYDVNSDNGKIPLTLKEADKYAEKRNVVFKKSVASDKYYWQLVCIAPEEALNTTIRITQYLIIGIIILLLILLVFLVRYFLKLNRKPLQEVLSLFGTKDENSKGDEYSKLYSLVTKTLEENGSLIRSVSERNKEIRILAVGKIIKGNLPYSELEEYNIRFDNEKYCIVSFYTDDISTLFSDDKSMSNFEKEYHLQYILNNILEELFSAQDCAVYTTEIDKNIVCLINSPLEFSRDQIIDIVKKCKEVIETYFNIEINFAVSNIRDEFLDISIAYEQTREIIDYNRLIKTDEDMSFSEMNLQKSKEYIFDFNKEQRLSHAINVGRVQEAMAIIELIFAELAREDAYRIDFIHYVVFDIASTITKCASGVMKNAASYEFESRLFKEINDKKSLSEILKTIKEYTIKICELTSVPKERKKSKCSAEDIMEFVKDNYTDSSFNVNTVGKGFNLTAAYVSKVFKENYDISLMDYIAKCRIEKALELIAGKKHSMSEISQLVGFNHERTFYRTLKKYNQDNEGGEKEQ